MMRARKITRPTGKPVRVIPPTGGSRIDARERNPEGVAYDPPRYSTRKSTKGGKVNVGDVLVIPELSANKLYERERQRILKRGKAQ